MKDKLSRSEIVSIYKIELHFFDELTAAGLLEVEEENDDYYLSIDHLSRIERFANLHYDLEINIPGIEVIDRLLNQLKILKLENNMLKNSVPSTIYLDEL